MNNPEMMVLYIQNMVCNRCIMAVEKIFADHDLTISSIRLGEVVITESSIPQSKQDHLQGELLKQGFSLLDDESSTLINRVRSIIIDRIHHSKEPEPGSWSKFLSESLGRDYRGLSRIFSQKEGYTIENFIIRQKVEKAKELLTYGDRSIKEIAYDLQYSSPGHLSAQFKQITGMSPSEFKALGTHSRKPLDKV